MNTKKHSGKRKSYTIPSDRPRNKADRDALKYAKTPSMYGYIKLPVGRPTKTIDSQTIGPSDTALAPSTAAAASQASSVKVKMSSKTRGLYNKYDNKSGRDAWVSSMLLNNDRKLASEAMLEAEPQAVVPRQTLNSLLISAKAKINAVTSGDLGTEYDIYQRTSGASDTSSLTSNSDRELLQHIAKSRDEMNRGMSRKEMIVLIAELFGVTYKTAENHFDYLIKSKQLNELKRGGRVVAAQATTTNRTAITSQKLLRTHNTTLLAWSKQAEWNGWDNRTCEQNLGEDLGMYIVRKAKEEEEFMKLKDCFTVNLDESCFMGSEGVLRIIGSAARKKHEKNTSDSRQSITIVRVGSAAGVEGPRIFLAKGVDLTAESMLKKNFARIHKAPIGSFVEMTPNAYMTNEVWMKIVPHLCDGIRAMEGITNHPDWWIVLSLDGFGSHLVGKSLEEFSKRKILVIKEEGDTSQVSQAYDQLVAKSDKKFTRALLDGYRFHTKGVINQFQLILIINSALNGTDAMSWLKSFVRVNMCPSKHVPFTAWVKKHEATVAAADRFFTNRSNLFDAMPASWQKLSEDDRRNVCDLFERFSGDYKKLITDFVALGCGSVDEIDKLRGCYLVTKEDPSVIFDPMIELGPMVVPIVPRRRRQWMLDDECQGFKFAPPKLYQPYLADKEQNHPPEWYWCDICEMGHKSHVGRCTKLSADLFVAMTNYVCYHHDTDDDMIPSPHLNVEVSADQKKALNPTVRDVQIGAVIAQIFGDKAKTKIAKRRIDFMTGNVNSYARILNGPAQMDSISTYNNLAASLSDYHNEMQAKKAIVAAEKQQADVDKAAKKVLKDKELEELHLLKLPICTQHVSEGLAHCLSLNLDRMKEILKHVFNITESNMRKPRAIELLTQALILNPSN
jgi:hypothetical protein